MAGYASRTQETVRARAQPLGSAERMAESCFLGISPGEDTDDGGLQTYYSGRMVTGSPCLTV
jgi:hypothetical protein